MNRQQIKQRVAMVAGQALQEKQYVSYIDILLTMGWLQPAHLDDWKKGKLPYLERAIQANLMKLNYAMECFRHWANQSGLKPSETQYMGRIGKAKRALQFSKSGHSAIECAYRTHYISPKLSEKKQQKLKQKLEKPPEQVVFRLFKTSSCDQCHQVLHKGSLLYKAQDEVFCMACSHFDQFVFLPSGDAKLTRRAKAYSNTYAVVVEFSHARKRYERKGLLVEKEALKRAEQELA